MGDGGVLKIARRMGSGRGWLAGDWLSTGGVLNITATAWTASFHWWRSGNITRTQNVSEYMLVLALCLVGFVNEALRLRRLKTVQTVRYLQCVQLGQLILSSIHCDE